MSTEKISPLYIRCFIANPGGAYNPAPLNELDHTAFTAPAVGDFINYGWHPAPKLYQVVQRLFALGTSENISGVSLLVEEVPTDSTPL